MRILLIIAFWLGFAALSHAQLLTPKLDSIRLHYASQMNSDNNLAYEASVSGIKGKVTPETMKKVGDLFPEVMLTNAEGISASLKEMLKQGPLIITYYRGGWCPYCNMTLRVYDGYMEALSQKGVQLVGVSNEEGLKLKQVTERNLLHFPLYTDKGLAGAKALGIAYEAKPGMTLPLGATYLIDMDGRIVYAFTETDYRQRAEPEDLMNALALLKPHPQTNKK